MTTRKYAKHCAIILALFTVFVCLSSSTGKKTKAQWQPAQPAMPAEPHEPALTFDDGWNEGKRFAENKYSALIAEAFGENCHLAVVENGSTTLLAVFPSKNNCIATRNSIRNDPDAQPHKRTWDCFCQAL